MNETPLYSGGIAYSLSGSIQSLSETAQLYKTRAEEAEAKLRLIEQRLSNIQLHRLDVRVPEIVRLDPTDVLSEALNDVLAIMHSGTRIRL